MSDDQDLINTLNQLLPNEQALQKAHLIQASLRTQLRQTRDEIAHLLTELKKDQSKERIQIVQSLIAELLLQTSRIKEKALESETIVRDITRDIQSLDRGKKNLVQTVTVLRQLGHLVKALDRLDALIPTKRYKDIADALSTVKEYASSFRPYATVDEVAKLQKAAAEKQAICRTMVSEEFENFFVPPPSSTTDPSSVPPSATIAVVASACHVVDVLGSDVRSMLLDRYCTLELREYRRIFRSTDEAGQLDNINRRYAYLRRILKSHEEEREPAFPKEWKVGAYLVARFAEVTSQDLRNVLSKKTPGSVTLLLEALQFTLDFEAQMSSKFNMTFQQIVSDVLPSSTYQVTSEPISKVFDPYLSLFIEAQDKAISDLLQPSRGPRSRASLELANPRASTSSRDGQGDKEADEEHKPKVLGSSTELFYFYGKTLEQFARFSCGAPMRDLVNVFKKYLKIYAEDVLLASLKREPMSRRSADRKSMEGRFNAYEFKNICLVLNTAEYCHTTAAQLEEMSRDKIEVGLRDEVSFQEEKDLFISVITTSLLSLLREVETTIDPITSQIARLPSWNTMENVSGPSNYVQDLCNAVDDVGDVVREGLEGKKYLRNFCDKAVGVVMIRLVAAVVRSRPIKKIGAEQLLLDFSLIKKSLMDLPKFLRDDARSISSYQRHVQNITSPFETLLKVILAPESPPEGFVQNFLLLVGSSSFNDFQKILDLKGTSRKDQSHLLDIFVSVVSVKDDLQDSSFLTTMDMDISAPVPSILSNASAADRALLFPTGNSSAFGDSRGSSNGNDGGPGTGVGGRSFAFFRSLTARRDN
ncbi:Late Golgi protein sorting complex, subunit Vps53 [Phaffia rhodozyma]|uniref:Late Golgi protein sorting complex, subunit Vps53 n=1 Tax=Phaffia rhodozyma TaxID=264483 RepID=A0A0F7SHE0_PHARH|nr:Late Golgi protein sorting complex, subunit Vps53 [Phaffia rhodozyma]